MFRFCKLKATNAHPDEGASQMNTSRMASINMQRSAIPACPTNRSGR
jgi:hypothetical protein